MRRYFLSLLAPLFLATCALAEQCQIISPLPMPVTINGCTFSGTLPNNSTSYIQNTLTPTTTGQQFSVQDSSSSHSETLGYIGGTQCLHSVNGAVSGTGSDCGTGTGGGGSAFSLAITTGGPNAFSGVAISSSNSTTEILFDSATTNGLKIGGTYYFTVRGDSVTLQGNSVTFQMVGLTTASLQTQITATSVSTGSLQTQITATALSTQTLATAVGLSTASLQTQITATALSTQTLANAVGASTASLQIQITATGVSTGSLAGNFPVSLSTNVVSILPVANGGTNTATPNLVAGTNITSITGTWPNQTINAATQSGTGTSFSMVITTGGPNSYSGNPISSSNVQTTLLFDSATVKGQFVAGATYFFTLNPSSVTLQGNAVTFQMVGLSTASLQVQITATGVSTGSLQSQVTATGVSTGSLQTQVTATGVSTGSLAGNFPISFSTNTLGTVDISAQTNLTASGQAVLTGDNIGVGQVSFSTGVFGTLQAAQEPAHTGDVTNSAGSLALTAFSRQPNITTFTSSITVTNLNGTTALYGIYTGTSPTVIGSGTGFSTPGQLQSISNGNNTYGLLVATSTTGLPTLSVSTAIALAPTDFLLTVSSAQGGASPSTMAFGVQNNGHLISSGTTPTPSSCGVTPVINGTDNAFTVTPGATATGCTITFAFPFGNNPVCVVDQQSMSLVNALSYTHSSTQISFSQVGAASSTYDVTCMGQKQ